MAAISRFGPFIAHLRADPNQHVLHYRGGRVARQGAGIAYWFSPLRAAVAQVPVEDVETTFLLKERAADFQDVSVQLTVTYRVARRSRGCSVHCPPARETAKLIRRAARSGSATR